MYLQDLKNATEIVLDMKHRVIAPGELRHSSRVLTSGGGSTGRAAAGAIRYLSEAGIGINAVRFGFYRAKDGREFLSRTFTLALEEAEKATANGKHTALTPAEMERRADDAGVGDLIVNAFVCLPHVSRTTKRTRPLSGFLERVEMVRPGLSRQQESGDTLVLARRKIDVAQNRQGGCYHGAVRTRLNFKSAPKLSNPLLHPPQTDAP